MVSLWLCLMVGESSTPPLVIKHLTTGRIFVLALAGARGPESLWFSVTNHLACGSVSNIFLVRDGVLLTLGSWRRTRRGLPSPVLPGIVRRTVVEAAESLGLTVKKEMLTIDDVLLQTRFS